MDWLDVKAKRIHLSYNGQDTMNNILKNQDDDFIICDIQMLADDGQQTAWVFYQGVYPDDRKSEPKPQPPQPVNPRGTLPAGIQLQSLMENKQ